MILKWYCQRAVTIARSVDILYSVSLMVRALQISYGEDNWKNKNNKKRTITMANSWTKIIELISQVKGQEWSYLMQKPENKSRNEVFFSFMMRNFFEKFSETDEFRILEMRRHH